MPVHYQVAGRTAAQISASVETGVRRGALVAGQPLPPVRELADELGVSPATVASAYKALRQRGIVETNGRNGTRIRPRPPVAPSRAARRPPVPPGVLDLSAGEPDPRLLPRVPALNHREPAGYRRAGPLPELADAARERLGVKAPALTVTGGALDGIDRLLAAHLRPGDRVAVEDPGWANLLDLVAAQGLSPVPVPVDEYGPRPDAFRAALAGGVGAVVVTSRAHNPTGACLSAARAALLRKELHGRDVLLVEDDHAAELSPEPLHPLAGATSRWAFVRSVAKPYGPDLRLAVLAGDEATVARVEGRMRAGTGWVSTILQRLVLALWTDDAVAAKVARARDSYTARRLALVEALRRRGLDATGRTGINVWVPVPDETGTVARLRDAGYAVAPGAMFRIGTPPGIRITISPLELRQLDRVADAVVSAATAASETVAR